MRDILFILISIFVSGNILTEWRNRKTLPWQTTPLSGYLADVPWAIVQDIGFFALATALLIIGHTFTAAGISFFVGGIALVMVVVTRYYIAFAGATPADNAIVERGHILSAGIAYTGAILGVLMTTWHTGGLANGAALAAVAVAFLVNRFVPGNTKLEEASVAGCLMVSLYAMVLA